MTHQDHINLIRKTIDSHRGAWADFGSGDGAFTLALADLTNCKAKIYSIDKDNRRLQNQKTSFEKYFPDTDITYINDDFTKSLNLPPLDGILMANSLHYIRDKIPLLNQIKGYLKDSGKLVVVEYNTDSGNPWVPYPFSFEIFIYLMERSGFKQPKLLSKTSSYFLDEIYSAEAIK